MPADALILSMRSGARKIAIDEKQFDALAHLYMDAVKKIEPVSSLAIVWAGVASAAVLVVHTFKTGVHWLDAAVDILSPVAWTVLIVSVFLFLFRLYVRLRRS